MTKTILLFFAILFFVCTLAPAKTHIVPDKYATIQEAVDAAQSRDTIIVREGVYTENVNIDIKHLTLKSEKGSEVTIVQAASSIDGSAIFLVQADHVNLNGFTIQNNTYGSGINLNGASNCSITNNIAFNNWYGILLKGFSNNNVIFNNAISFNKGKALILENSYSNTIHGNDISNNNVGISVSCYSNSSTTAVPCSSKNLIRYNHISGNNHGVELGHSSNNFIYLNNLLNNIYADVVSSDSDNTWNTPDKQTYTYNGLTYTNFLGNCWSDYPGHDFNRDGVGDAPYTINSDKDDYPLMESFDEMGVTLFTTWVSPGIRSFYIRGVASSDIDRDGIKEIIVSTGQPTSTGRVYAFNGVTYVEEWKNSDFGSSRVAAGDLNGDGIEEIIFGSSRISILNGLTYEIEWQSGNLVNRANSLRIDDIDGDGTREIIAGTRDNGNNKDAHVYVFDGVSHVQEWVSSDLCGGITLYTGDVDGDGTKEIVCGTRDGYVYVFDGLSHEQQWKSRDLGGYLRGVVIDDIDGNGTVEMIIANAEGDIYIFDGATYTQKYHWQSKMPRAGWISALAVDDLDGDGVKEIIAGLMVGDSLPTCGTGYIYVFDAVTYGLKKKSDPVEQFIGISGMVIDDVDNDGQKEIITGGRSHIYVFDNM